MRERAGDGSVPRAARLGATGMVFVLYFYPHPHRWFITAYPCRDGGHDG